MGDTIPTEEVKVEVTVVGHTHKGVGLHMLQVVCLVQALEEVVVEVAVAVVMELVLLIIHRQVHTAAGQVLGEAQT